jgi:hypothetical protein
LLGAALLEQDRFVDAEPVLLAACEGMKRLVEGKPTDLSDRLAVAMERLIKTYTALGRHEDAARWTAERKTIAPSPAESR